MQARRIPITRGAILPLNLTPGSRPHISEAVVPRATILEFLNRLPATGHVLSWVTQFREDLLLLFPDVDHVTVTINTDCDITNPGQYESDLVSREHLSGGASLGCAIFIADKDRTCLPSDSLLADFRANGYPLERFHDPVPFDYFLGDGKAYLGTVFLWVAREGPPLSSATIDEFKHLERFIRFSLSDLVARHQSARPFDRAFNDALQYMIDDAQLSSQERRVVILQLFGHSYDEIAIRLHISIETVRKHVKAIYRKTGTPGNTGLFAKYFTPRLGF